MAKTKKGQLAQQIREKLNEARDERAYSKRWKEIMREVEDLQDQLAEEWEN